MSIKDIDHGSGFRRLTDKKLTTLFTGKHCISLNEVDSTNSRMMDYLNSLVLPEGATVRAANQVKGKGQFGTRWVSEAGKNLLQSFVFYPLFVHPRDVFSLNETFALGVYDFVSSILGDDVRIKWPNDIFYGEKKIGGLLVENSISGIQLMSSVLGVGININQTDFPDDIKNATSYAIVKKQNFDLDELFFNLCSSIENRYESLRRGELDDIDDEYNDALFGLGEKRRFKNKNGEFSATIEGVAEEGKLLLLRDDGSLEKYSVKEISFLFE